LRLREGVRFHDGRHITYGDVRYSSERLLRTEGTVQQSILSPIAGASRLLSGGNPPLEGFQVRSQREFAIVLEKPVAFFPALLTNIATSIIPEGSKASGASWRDGCVGSGPF